MRPLLALIPLASLLFAGCGASPDATDRPATAERAGRYLGRTIAPTAEADPAHLVRTERAREERIDLLYRALNLTPGMTACDVGAGNGFHSLELARRVYPGGRVIATDLVPSLLAALRERVAVAQATGDPMVEIETIESTPTDAKLPEGGCHLVLLVAAYHEFGHPAEMLAQIRAALPADGRVAIVEYRAEDRAVAMKRAHKMKKAQIHREMKANGFRLIGQLDALPTQHALLYGRDDGPRPGVALRAWRRAGSLPPIEGEATDAARPVDGDEDSE